MEKMDCCINCVDGFFVCVSTPWFPPDSEAD